MNITIEGGTVTEFVGDTIIVPLPEGVTEPEGATGAVDAALGGLLTQLITAGEVKGKLNNVSIIHTQGKLPALRVIVVGLGKPGEVTVEKIRQAAGTAIKAARRSNGKLVGLAMPSSGVSGLDVASKAQALAEGALLALFRFKKYVTKPLDDSDPQTLTILTGDRVSSPALEAAVARGRILAEGTNMARELISEPGNEIYPETLARRAEAMARASGLEFEALEERQMSELGMGAVLAVGQGSRRAPRFIIMRYWGAGKDNQRPPLALIGKGVTFDSGGISLKPGDKMEEMKGDMSGAAAVIGAMRIIAQLKPKINVVALVPAVENMPGGNAARPGDIIRTCSGKTFEIISTDAEGRLILADAVAYARKLGCSPLIDVATLTGAVMVALGFEYTGAFANDQPALDAVLAAAKTAGEKVWPMPTDDEYKDQLQSDVADLKNSGGRYGGAITGALFIGAFAEDTPWVHLDIAGTSKISDGKDRPYQPKFGSGAMTRTLALLAEHMAAQARAG